MNWVQTKGQSVACQSLPPVDHLVSVRSPEFDSANSFFYFFYFRWERECGGNGIEGSHSLVISWRKGELGRGRRFSRHPPESRSSPDSRCRPKTRFLAVKAGTRSHFINRKRADPDPDPLSFLTHKLSPTQNLERRKYLPIQFFNFFTPIWSR
jgi:hypothetical protein